MRRAIRNVLTSGIESRLTPEQSVKLLFVNTVILMGLVVLGFFAGRDWVLGRLDLALPTTAVSLVIIGLFFAIRITKSPTLGAWFLPFLMFGFYTYLNIAGGPNTTAALWSLTFPLIVMFMVGAVWGAVFALVFMLTQLVLFFVPGISPLAETAFEYKIRMAGTYTILFSFSLAFEVIRKRTQTRLETLTRQLEAAKVQTDGILAHVGEGIFLLDEALAIGPQHSRSLTELLGPRARSGAPFLDSLKGRMSDRDVNATQDYLELYFLPSPPWHLMAEINPLSEVSLTQSEGPPKHLTFTFDAFDLPEGRRVLATVRDETQAKELSRKLQEEEGRSARQMKHLFQIVHVKPRLLLQFLQDADEEIAAINRRLKDPKAQGSALIEALFQGVHAIKGDAQLIGLSSFAQTVHELETRVVDVRARTPVWEDFLDLTVRLSLLQAELNELRHLMAKMTSFQRDLEAAAGSDLLVMTLDRAVATLTRQTGRAIDLDRREFDVDNVPEAQRKLVKDVLLQFLRNSVAHGFEPADERVQRGKSERPRVKIATTQNGRTWTLSYWDDGRGIDPQAVRRRLNDAALSDEAATQAVLSAGVSTASQVGLDAGRGVGLALVKERVEAVGGRLRLRSVPTKGVAFDITLPLP